MTCMMKTVFIFVVLFVSTSSWKFPDAVTPVAFGGNLNPRRDASKPRNHSDFFCPDGCACSSQEKIIDCSSLGLSDVPAVPKETSRLYLHNNHIESMDPRALSSLQHLTYLILSGNEISSVQESSFIGLASLKYLILDGNNISTLPIQLFSNLRQLETISLARNELEVLPGGLFATNNRLTLLNLQGNRLGRVEGGAFDGLVELSTLNLDDNLLDERVFEELKGHPRLNTLRLNNNQIKRFPRSGLSLPALKYLSLQDNQLTHLHAPLMTYCGVLETLILNRNQIEKVEGGVFQGCANLSKLEMRENVISFLSANVFTGLTGLKNLYLHKNSLSSLSPGLLQHLHSIQAIYLCYNKLSWIPSGVFTGLSTLSTIHLEWNKLTEVSPSSFVDLPSLETLYLHHNNISDLQPGTFVNVQKLKNLDLYSNQLTSLKPGVLSMLHSLKKVQVDPLTCSCDLLYLTTWSKRHHIRGLTCRASDGRVYSILNLGKLCHNSSRNVPHKTTSPNKSATLPEPPRTVQMQGPQTHQERKPTVTRLKDTPTVTVPKGPIVHRTSAEKVLLKLDEIQHSVVQLQFRLSHVESLLDKRVSHARERRVCIHERTRLEVGDWWRDGQHTCTCSEEGKVECSLVGD